MKIIITKSGSYSYTLDQPNQELEVIGRFKLDGREKLDLNVVIVHKAIRTKASVSLKATVNGQARASIIGTIIVEAGAVKTESFLEERILLLSDKATAEAIPNLEIKTNEVKCSHAATVGQIDSEQLFYLSSRGVSETEAKSLIADAFLK